jgi:hypothetical protein
VIARLRQLVARVDPAWRHSLTAYAGVRAYLTALAILVLIVYPGASDAQPEFRQKMGIPPIAGPVQNALWGVWMRWDTMWYIRYARDGLLPADHPEYRAFWPLYPWLMRWLAPLFGGSFLVSGLAIANLALIGTLVLFYKLTEDECDAETAQRATWYTVLFPSAFFFFCAYSESLFLLFVLAAFHAARRKRWIWAALWVALSSVVRVSGAFALPALGVEYVRQQLETEGWAAMRRTRWWVRTALGAWPFAIGIVGVVFVPVYTMLFLHGEDLSTVLVFHVNTAVAGEGLVLPWTALGEAVRALASGSFFAITPFDLGATLLFLGLTVATFLRLPVTYGVYMLVTVLALTTRSIPQHPLIGGSRYVITLFPGFMLLGQVGRKPWGNRLVVYPSMLLSGFFVAEFIIGGFVG